MKPKRCKQCSTYMNEEEDCWWCSACDGEEFKQIQVKYKDDE